MDVDPPSSNRVREEGAELALQPPPTQENPWVKYAGIWKDEPNFDEFLEAVAEYRRERDEADRRE